MSQFQRMVGVKRGYGQAPHNRGLLHYRGWDGCCGALEGVHRRTARQGLRLVFCAGCWAWMPHQQIILTLEWCLRLAGLLGLSFTAMPGASWPPTSSFSPGTDTRLAPRVGRRHPDPGRRGPLQGPLGPNLQVSKVAASLDLRKNGSLLFGANRPLLARRAPAAIPPTLTFTANSSSSP